MDRSIRNMFISSCTYSRRVVDDTLRRMIDQDEYIISMTEEEMDEQEAEQIAIEEKQEYENNVRPDTI